MELYFTSTITMFVHHCLEILLGQVLLFTRPSSPCVLKSGTHLYMNTLMSSQCRKNVRISSQENCIYFLGHENTIIAFLLKIKKLEVNIAQVVDIHIILLKHPKHMHSFESFSFSLETYCGGY